MYEIGRVHVWQNLTGKFAHLNGTETTVLAGLVEYMSLRRGGRLCVGQKTDTPWPNNECGFLPAGSGDLRAKNPPTGEQKIRSMFEPKPVMEVA